MGIKIMKKRKKALLCLSILTHAVFWGSLASSLLGRPIYSGRRGNFILLIALGATAAILSTAFILTRKQSKGDDIMEGGASGIVNTITSSLVNKVSYVASAVKSKAGYGSTETGKSLQKKKEPLIQGLCKVDGKEGTSLGEALGKLKLEWLLIYLDHSLIQVEQGKKPKDWHEQYFKDQVNQPFRRLSLTHHPDKSGSNDDAQRVINDVWQAMRKIHEYAMHIKDKGGSVYRERGYI
ncbi:J domain-containing protein [Candidatus Mesenet endosymbiont of Agriotes lineatus]|uniref:J domain-containing protein n=1 Tax=Candidatus Mesenet endosymbiont of Agriotes lineatus TaxID=3077948 RepID=UPI0030D11107